jgi:hypothetical protein
VSEPLRKLTSEFLADSPHLDALMRMIEGSEVIHDIQSINVYETRDEKGQTGFDRVRKHGIQVNIISR